MNAQAIDPAAFGRLAGRAANTSRIVAKVAHGAREAFVCAVLLVASCIGTIAAPTAAGVNGPALACEVAGACE